MKITEKKLRRIIRETLLAEAYEETPIEDLGHDLEYRKLQQARRAKAAERFQADLKKNAADYQLSGEDAKWANDVKNPMKSTDMTMMTRYPAIPYFANDRNSRHEFSADKELVKWGAGRGFDTPEAEISHYKALKGKLQEFMNSYNEFSDSYKVKFPYGMLGMPSSEVDKETINKDRSESRFADDLVADAIQVIWVLEGYVRRGGK